jgi:YfiH family protein
MGGAVPILRFAILERAGVPHGVTTRRGGVSAAPFDLLNLGLGTGDERARVDENRRRALLACGLGARALARMEQAHGARVAVVEGACVPAGAPAPETDALLTCEPGSALLGLGADCCLVLLCDPRSGAVGVVHSGWRGTAAGVGPEAVRRLCERWDARPGDLLAGLGPAIGACCYEVGADVAAAFAGSPRVRPVGSRWRLDLAGAIADGLEGAGLDRARIERLDLCTACRPDDFFSHRRDGARTGRHGALIGPARGAVMAGPKS